jgi:hypothetical protein
VFFCGFLKHLKGIKNTLYFFHTIQNFIDPSIQADLIAQFQTDIATQNSVALTIL